MARAIKLTAGCPRRVEVRSPGVESEIGCTPKSGRGFASRKPTLYAKLGSRTYRSRQRKSRPKAAFKSKSDVTDYRRTPTRLTPPFKLPPALLRTAARATGRGLSTTPARATQPTGYSTYWQYTTALAGAGLRVRPASPNRALAAIPAAVADWVERRFLGCMADSPSCLLDYKVTGAALCAAKHSMRRQRIADVDLDQRGAAGPFLP